MSDNNINDMANPSNMAPQAVRTATDEGPKAPTLTIDKDSGVTLCTIHPDGSITGQQPELCSQKHLEPLASWIIVLLSAAAGVGIASVIRRISRWQLQSSN